MPTNLFSASKAIHTKSRHQCQPRSSDSQTQHRRRAVKGSSTHSQSHNKQRQPCRGRGGSFSRQRQRGGEGISPGRGRGRRSPQLSSPWYRCGHREGRPVRLRAVRPASHRSHMQRPMTSAKALALPKLSTHHCAITDKTRTTVEPLNSVPTSD